MSSGPSLSPRLDSGADALQHNSSHLMHCFSGENLLVLTCVASDGMRFGVFLPFSFYKHSHLPNTSLSLPVLLYRNEGKCAFYVISDQQSVVPGHSASPTPYILPAQPTFAFPRSGLLHPDTVHLSLPAQPFHLFFPQAPV